jgi:D-alanine--poly(phosphoribitol) ligase subunit 1
MTVLNHHSQKISHSVLETVSREPFTQTSLFYQYGFGDSADLPFETLTQAFSHQVKMHPNSVACEADNRSLTYLQLDQASDVLASYLQHHNIGQGDAVGVFLQRSTTMLVAMLACFKVGAAYVPQDARIAPIRQMKYVVDVSKIKLILSQSQFETALAELECEVLAVDTWLATEHHTAANLLSVLNRQSDTAFILFTSGTTGNPNGVQVSHKNLVNILLTKPGNLNIQHGTKVSQLLAISFDMAAWEIWGCLCNGGTLLIRDKCIADTAQKANVIIATPSVLATIDAAGCHNIATVIVAGEPCPESLAQHWSQYCDFYNSCGPTETTIINTAICYKNNKPLSIGIPTPNNNVYILNERMEPCEIGDVGMMWAGGYCVTKGYINNDLLNDQRYKPDPFVGGNQTMFRTGDLGRWNEFGELEHLGRADDQVKVRGFRVELDSVSQTVEALTGVERAVTLKYDRRHLVCFIQGGHFSVEQVAEQVTSKLPYYCAPVAVFCLDKLPQTDRGKIDKRQLMAQATLQLGDLLENDHSVKGATV